MSVSGLAQGVGKIGLYIFKCLEKNQKYFCDTWKLYEIQISASINKVFLEYSHTHLFKYLPMAAVSLYQQWWVAVTKIEWPTEPKIFDLLQKNVHWPSN